MPFGALLAFGVLLAFAVRPRSSQPARAAVGQSGQDVDADRRLASSMLGSARDELRRIYEDSFPQSDATSPKTIAAYKRWGNRSVARLGPAIDYVTHGASQRATNRAWMLNGQLAAIQDTSLWYERHAEQLANEILSLYTNAFAPFAS